MKALEPTDGGTQGSAELMGQKQRQRSASRERSPVVDLDYDELEILVQVARYYERSMGFMRHIVLLTAPTLRTRYRFIKDESRWLQRFAETTRDEIAASGATSAPIALTPRALVAFWGRLLALLASRRARRKLSPEALEARESMADKLQAVASTLPRTVLDEELATRRPVEAAWMRERLGL